MHYLTKIAAAVAAAAILLLAPGAQAALPEDWGPGRGNADHRPATSGTVMDCPPGMMQTFCGHYGLETEDAVPTTGGPPVDEPDTTGLIIGWTAAGVAVGSAGVAGLILLRRRMDHGELPHAA